jgi:TonB-dependent receptor
MAIIKLSSLSECPVARLKGGISLLAICLASIAAPAFAQDTASADTETATEDSDDIVVTGIRQSLANSQSIKKNADTVVDAITAEDIGALPDRSVTEALQRVPGVSINRFAGSNDPDHFSVEGSGAVIRGLNFVRSEFNGRDAFAAGGYGQGLNFADVPAELLGSVEVYKNATADMIEGGLAGTVNLNTRKPFDNKGFHIGFGIEGSYGDFEKKWSPSGSLLVSNTWETDAGTFGLLASGSYSRVRSRADGLQVTNYQTRDGLAVERAFAGGTLVCRNPLPSGSDASGYPANLATLTKGQTCFGPAPAGADGFADTLSSAITPLGGQFRTQNFDRKRDGQAFAAQFETSDRASLFTVQYIRSHSTNAWKEKTFESGSDLSEYNTYPLGCRQNTNGPAGTTRAECPVGGFTNYQYDADGLFQSGYVTNPGGGWRGNPFTSIWVPLGGMQQNVVSRQVFEEVTNQDLGLNAKFDFDDHWHLDLDFDYTKSRKQNSDISLIGGNFADEEIDLTGALPQITPHKPNTLFYDWSGVTNPDLAAMNDTQYFGDRRTQFWRAAMDHFEDSTGNEYAFRGDLTYRFDEGSFLKEVKVGARYADRSQVVRYSSYNWGMLSETWSGNRPISVADVGGDNVSYYGFDNFFRGQANGPQGGYYYNGDMIRDYNSFVGFTNQIRTAFAGVGGGSTWLPASQRAGASAEGYLPAEIQPVTQQDTNAYILARFGSEDPLFGDVRLSGNVGVRYVSTSAKSLGSIGVPSATALSIADPYSVRCAPGINPITGLPMAPGGICTIGAAAYGQLQTWSGAGSTAFNAAENNYTYWLPSLNLKFGISEDVLVRFAASKVLTRPQNDYIRNYVDIGLDNDSLTATAGNPFLKPATAWQFDLTGEWYFAEVGSLTFDIFYKDVKNFFYQEVTQRDITSNGVTLPIFVRGPANFGGHGKIKGFELAYQQTFDFLPGLLSGFGVNANYTYIKSKGLPNSFLNGAGLPSTSTIVPGNLPLEQLSKHNINFSGFYEKGPISLRAAYNWRSRFLLTASDVIFPFYSIFNEPTGQLDASAFFSITKNLKIGVQGVNLLNEITKTSQAYSGDPNKLAPRSYFMNDRRFSFILRGNF